MADGDDRIIYPIHKLMIYSYNVIILSFWTDRSGQTVQTQIRQLLEEQSDQSLLCLHSICIFLMKYSMVWYLFLILGRLQQSFLASENLGILRYSADCQTSPSP